MKKISIAAFVHQVFMQEFFFSVRGVLPEKINIELGNAKEVQLYDLSADIGQQQNIAKEKPELVNELLEEYKSIVGDVEVEALELK